MPRTTTEQVEEIIEVDETITSLDPFILMASELVTEVCVPFSYSDERLELIERWLAAHFYCSRDPRISYEVAGAVAGTYQYKIGLFLANSSYGQMALTLDTQGGLARLSKNMEEGRKKTTAGIIHLAETCEHQIDPLE